jgi:carboxylate-amine ligase
MFVPVAIVPARPAPQHGTVNSVHARAHWANWHPSDAYTVGIEEEVMLLDPGSWALDQRADDMLDALSEGLLEAVSGETHEAALELRTGVHRTVPEAIAELGELRRRLAEELGALGMAVAASGAYPDAMSEQTKISPADRARQVEETMRELARREPTYALHIHVGVPDPERAIALLNRLRLHLPLFLALSASSPFWRGRNSGLASIRTVLFHAFPRTGVPRRFDDYDDWVQTVDLLIRSGAIPEPTFLWWDIRPQPALGTVEVRIMDAQPRLEDTAALCALVQSLARLELERDGDSAPAPDAQEALSENCFLAARDGAAAELIDVGRAVRVPLTEHLAELLGAAAPHAAALGDGGELARVSELARLPEASRQEALAERVGLSGLLADLAERFTEHV